MIRIENNKIYVDDTETTDPTLIGLAILDQIDLNSILDRKTIITDYIKNNSLRQTRERDKMIEIISKMKSFDTEKFVIDCEESNISRPTAYNFINLLKKAEVITQKQYHFL